MRSRIIAFVAALALAASMATGATAKPTKGFRTSEPSMLDPVMPGVQVTPLLTVGDQLADGYTFESIPDGISVRSSRSTVELFVNHETSKVPFPYNPTITDTDPAESQNDFDNAQVSRITLNRSARVLSGTFVIPSALGYQRFCSNFLATSAEGFDRPVLLTNEESPDWVFRQEQSWPPPLSNEGAEESGVVVAHDLTSGETTSIYGMGRHNHENAVAIPGYDELVVLSGDDTFTSGALTDPTNPPAVLVPSQSQLYSYTADDTDSLLADEGTLWAFVSDDPDVNDYYDFAPGSDMEISGHFIQVPEPIASGKDDDGNDITSADVGYPPPPTDGTWQRELRNPAVGVDGPQWVLEYWSDTHDVFTFVRVEDIAYDKRPGMENVVYVVDSGRGSSSAPAQGVSTNGRVWKLVLDPDDPTVVTSMSILVEGDDNPVKTPTEVHQPDNIESTRTGILLTEDPGSGQQFPVGSTDPNATTARLWYVPFSGTAQVVAKVNQSADEGPTDVDPADNPPFVGGAFAVSPGNWGAWESSGIVDASAAFGKGAFLIDVQAHTLWVDSAPGEDHNADGKPDFFYKREGGQLLLIRIPGI